MLPTILRHRGLRAAPAERPGDVPDEGQGGGGRGGTRGRWILHPFLIAVFPILALYAHNVYETLPRSLVAPMAIALAGTLAVWLPLRWLIGGQRAGLATSLLLAAFYAFNHGKSKIDSALTALSFYWIRNSYSVHPLLVLAVYSPVLLVLLYLIVRRLKNPASWTAYLNVFSLVLVVLPAVSAIQARSQEPARPIIRSGGGIPIAARPERLPDIYHIVLDAYARSDVMNDLFGFDNGPFLKRLEEKGFFVARKSTANYCQTPLSLASTLNCDYLDKLVNLSGHDLQPLTTLIRDNLVMKSLRPHGYRFVTFATGYNQTECPGADLYLGPRHPSDGFHMMLIGMTPLRYLPLKPISWDYYISIRERVLFTLDHLPDIAEVKEPTFTLAHIVSPHHPFVFGENGEDISPRQSPDVISKGAHVVDFSTPEEYQKNYRKQAIFLTRKVEETIDRILANSPEPPIIILQSDHGSGFRHHLNDLERTDLRERLSILNCYYFPGRKYQDLTDDITPVNSYRALLNAFFDTRLSLHENKNFFSTYENAFDLIDVTERLRSGRDRGRIYTPPSHYAGMVH